MRKKTDEPCHAGGKKKKSLPDFSSWVRGYPQGNEETDSSKQIKPEAGLYLVSTPIGNLGDITLRALWLLQKASLILCEDTRMSGMLLHAYDIRTPLLSCHEHNEEARITEVLARLDRGEAVALISDAGTPLLSDPGYRLVRACKEAGHLVIAAPGASALLTALVCAGLPTDRFLFAGFLPTKQKARRDALSGLASIKATLLFYESPQRLAATLTDMKVVFSGQRQAVVCRELTKLFEETREGSLEELAAYYETTGAPKGEIVILVAPNLAPSSVFSEEDVETLLRNALQKMSVRDATAFVAEETGLKKKDLYRRALKGL